MKKLLTLFAFSLSAYCANGQTTATDFTAIDCNSVSHNLFSELNSGKVIVLVWVMPCFGCIAGGNAAYNAVQSFATSHPGKVKYYLIDDLGDENCAALSSWASTNGINTANITIFGNANNEIKESDYGGTGMPHVAVIGGANHKIWIDLKDVPADDQPAITNAISSALNPTGVNDLANQIQFYVSPNPVTGSMTINYPKEVKQVTISSLNGQVVMQQEFETGKTNPSIDISGVASGVYMVRVSDVDGKAGVQKIVKD